MKLEPETVEPSRNRKNVSGCGSEPIFHLTLHFYRLAVHNDLEPPLVIYRHHRDTNKVHELVYTPFLTDVVGLNFSTVRVLI